MRRIVALITLAIVGPSFGAFARAVEITSLAPMSKPLVAISGTDSHVSKPSYQLVTSPEEWTRVWVSHLGTTRDNAYRPLLEVDFDRCVVVVIFRGVRVNIRQLEVHSLSETADSVVIRFDELGYQTSVRVGEDDEYKVPDRPYAFVILPKTDKTIVLEENINRDVQREAPVWKAIARLSGAQKVTRPQRPR
jgi:hypothetical protein